MNREIKFRAWVESGGDKELNMRPYLYMVTQGEEHVKTLRDFMDVYSGHILMQYTGLKDKNGKEIYEGDILSVKPNGGNYPIKYVVLFNDHLAFTMRFIDRYLNNESSFYDERLKGDDKAIFEIIGNIYSNPELLNP